MDWIIAGFCLAAGATLFFVALPFILALLSSSKFWSVVGKVVALGFSLAVAIGVAAAVKECGTQAPARSETRTMQTAPQRGVAQNAARDTPPQTAGATVTRTPTMQIFPSVYVGWSEIAPQDSTFRVLYPTDSPEIKTSRITNITGTVKPAYDIAYLRQSTGVVYSVAWADHEMMLDSYAELVKAQNLDLKLSGTKLVRSQNLAMGGRPCLDYLSVKPGFTLRSRACVDRNRYLVNLAAAWVSKPKADSEVARFFDSLTFK